MASVRTMTLGQNIHMMSNMSNSCVLMSANMLAGKSQQMFATHGKRPLAPAPTVLTSNGANQVINIPKKKYNYTAMQNYQPNQTASVARRNARERNRVKQVNNGFSNLRQHIPQTVVSALTKGGRGSAKKLSKVDTLKMAVEYIRSLKDMLDDNENNSTSGQSSSGYSFCESSQLPRSEASLSPTPSYSSDASSQMSYTPNHHTQSHQPQFKQEPFDTYIDPSTSPAPSYHSDIPIHHQQTFIPTSTPYKHTHQYDNYSPVSPDDEEILDAIAWWQQQ